MIPQREENDKQHPNLVEILKKENPSLADFGVSREDYQNSAEYFKRKIPYTWTPDCELSKKAWMLMVFSFKKLSHRSEKIDC